MEPKNYRHPSDRRNFLTKCISAGSVLCMGCLDAADVGYAIECYPSDAAGKAFNPKTKASGGKNMMKGDEYCVERWELT